MPDDSPDALAARLRMAFDLCALGESTVSVRTEPRLTRDADLAVLVADDHDAESLVRQLQTRGCLTLIAQRGFHRGRDLLATLDATVEEFSA